MAQEPSNLLMRIEGLEGGYESQTVVKNDPLAKDFSKDGKFFEIDDFSFELSVEDKTAEREQNDTAGADGGGRGGRSTPPARDPRNDPDRLLRELRTQLGRAISQTRTAQTGFADLRRQMDSGAFKSNPRKVLRDASSEGLLQNNQALSDALARYERVSNISSSGSGGGFDRFMNNVPSIQSPGNGRVMGFAASLGQIDISRKVDLTSLALFQACCDRRCFASASIIRRKVAGGKRGLQSFMRIDLKNVLVSEIGWEDDEIVQERVSLHALEISVSYARQRWTGELDTSAPNQAGWVAPERD